MSSFASAPCVRFTRNLVGALAIGLCATVGCSRHDAYTKAMVDNVRDRAGFINTRGGWDSPDNFFSCRSFSEGLAAVEVTNGFGKGGHWGYIDHAYKLVIPAIFHDAEPFSKCLAAVRVESEWGYIDRRGEYVVAPSFSRAWPIKEMRGMFRVEEGNQSVLPAGRDMVRDLEAGSTTSSASSHQSETHRVEKYGFIDEKGRIVVPPIYEQAYEFSEGLAAVQKNGKWGFIDRDGNVVIDFLYSGAGSFSEGVAGVRLGDKTGFIDRFGRWAIAARFDSFRNFSEGYAVVKVDGRCGYVDHAGRMVIPARYQEADDFHNGLAVVTAAGKDMCIDTGGRLVKRSNPLDAQPRNGLTMFARKVSEDCTLYGYADRHGDVVIPAVFFMAWPFSEGVAAVKSASLQDLR